jgi:ArsR family transcriptional regulator
MAVDLELAPKQKRPAGERCCDPVVYPDVDREQALRMAEVARALGDPIRLQLVDVLRKHAGKVCVCASSYRCSRSHNPRSRTI